MNVSRIFLSHSHKDNDWCSAFVDELKRYGVDVWYDKQSLYVGAKWLQTIETELEGRDTFLVVLTPNSWASDWVRDEIALALAQHKRIVSILHQTTQVSGFITTYQMLDVIGLSSVEAAKSVAAALGLARLQQPATSKGAEFANEEYEYFEATVYSDDSDPDIFRFQYQLNVIGNGEVFYTSKWIGNLNIYSAKAHLINDLLRFAEANGLEELPEERWEWYSHRFRRKKQ